MLANATAGVAYFQAIGVEPQAIYEFSVVSGELPAGLTLDPSTGVISGMPMVTGSYSFIVQATGAGGCSGVRSYTLVVASASTLCSQTFDLVPTPSLPSNWTSAATGSLRPWVTSTVNPASTSGNAAFAGSDASVGWTELNTPFFAVSSAGAQMTFRNAYNLEAGTDNPNLGYDGMVLEISILGGPFQDIVAAGGGFVTGGYNKLISSEFGSPLSGRMAWSGLSGGTAASPQYLTTTVNLPPAANGRTVRVRWVVATDSKEVATGLSGAWIDSIIGGACSFTAAGVDVSGRVTTPDGRGLRNAVVRISDGSGAVRSVTTGSFGYYRFEDIEVGRTYVISVGSRRYRFAPRLVNVSDTLTDVNFIAME